MKKTKGIVLPITIALAIGVISITALAASNYSSPPEAVAGLTGTRIEDVIAKKVETGATYGSIAADAGKLEEFQEEMVELKKVVLDKKVENGTMTQERADEVLARIEERRENCDGTGSGNIGQSKGAGFGQGNAMRNGQGKGLRNGQGKNCTATSVTP